MYYLEAASFALSAMAAVGTFVIAIVLGRLWRSYELENRALRVQRTLAAVQIPEHVSPILTKVLWSDFSGTDNMEQRNVGKIFGALDYFENLAIGIRAGVYDERLAYERLGEALPKFYFTVVKLVYVSRSQGTAPALYIQLDRLARDWQRSSPTQSEIA
ncbi:hypothetical protein HU761_22740 [Pseudomonas sp. SWRI59]|uniref:DUF4760 domain-containing protein n=1 Tax=unclassified Pseudomonas TaxID=196821 RepID=UPI00164693B6|nr:MULTISPECIES: hypothetical protein [unclassified Pseudomonas]MBC3504206.1 hypothetical protein [Pseudomonas sp. SWRI59]MBC3509520.1 hypothetical protein [Pseudomonas sp. SWRI68]